MEDSGHNLRTMKSDESTGTNGSAGREEGEGEREKEREKRPRSNAETARVTKTGFAAITNDIDEQ